MNIQAASQTQIQDDKYHTMVPLTSGPPVIRVSRQSQTRASAQQHPRRHYSYQATALDSKSTWGGNLMLGRQPHGHRPPPTPPKSQVCTLQKIKRISRHISIQCNTILLSTLINLARTLTPAAVPTALELIHVVYSTIFSIRSTREIQNLDKN